MSARFTHRQAFLQLTSLLVLSFAMIGVISNVTTIQTWLSQALGEEADLVIEMQTVIGPLTTPWRSIAQGGEH